MFMRLRRPVFIIAGLYVTGFVVFNLLSIRSPPWPTTPSLDLLDVDGTATGCHCVEPEAFRWPPKDVTKLKCADGRFDLTMCVRVNSSTNSVKTRLQARVEKLYEKAGLNAVAPKKATLLHWYRMETDEQLKKDYGMRPLAINASEYVKRLAEGESVPFVSQLVSNQVIISIHYY